MRVIEYTKSRQHVKLTNFSTANSQAFLDQYESHKIFFFLFSKYSRNQQNIRNYLF